MATAPSSDAASPPAQAHAPDLDNALWRFVLSFYAREGVSAACLTLQDKLGVDVDILLLAIFAQAERGILLDANDVAAVDALVRDWRSEIIQPLRCVRTRLKTGHAPAPSAITEPLRDRVKAAELEAEQIELAMLADWLDRQPPRPTNAAGAARAVLTVARYFQTRSPEGPLAPEVENALRILAQATDVGRTTGAPQE